MRGSGKGEVRRARDHRLRTVEAELRRLRVGRGVQGGGGVVVGSDRQRWWVLVREGGVRRVRAAREGLQRPVGDRDGAGPQHERQPPHHRLRGDDVSRGVGGAHGGGRGNDRGAVAARVVARARAHDSGGGEGLRAGRVRKVYGRRSRRSGAARGWSDRRQGRGAARGERIASGGGYDWPRRV